MIICIRGVSSLDSNTCFYYFFNIDSQELRVAKRPSDKIILISLMSDLNMFSETLSDLL